MKIDTKLYLALPKDEYVGEYVAPAGAHWVERFNKVYERLRIACRRKFAADQFRSSEIDTEFVISVLGDSQEMPRWLQGKSPYTVGHRSAIWMDTDGSIADLVDKAEKQGIKVVHIDCTPWREGEPAVADVPVAA